MTAALSAEAPARLRITHPRPVPDLEAAEVAAAAFMEALGIALDDPDLEETPSRFARAYASLLDAPDYDFTTFANTEAYDELVMVRDIPVQSVCEHHLLPFTGVAHVGYLPGTRIVGLSKLARSVDHLSRRPQIQERLTMQVARLLQARLDAQGVGVVVEAEHTCMTLRGACAGGSRTITSSVLGRLRTDAAARAEFLSLARGGAR